MSKREAFLESCCTENVDDFLRFIQLHRNKTEPFDVEEVLQEMNRDQRQTLWGKLSSLLQDAMEVEAAADPSHVRSVVDGVTLVAAESLKVLQDGETYSSLLEIIHRLHDLLELQPVSEAPLQLQILRLCDAWWKKDLKEKETFGRSAMIIALTKSFDLKKPGTEIQRVWSLREVLLGLDYTSEDNKQMMDLLLKCFQRPAFLRNDDGKRFLVFLFSWNINFISVIHGTIKNQLSSLACEMVTAHIAEIYFRAWKKAGGDFLEKMESSCVQDLMQNAIFLHRSSPIVSYFHSRKGCEKVDKMLSNLYKPILWKALSAPNFEVRANATLLFTEAFPVLDMENGNKSTDEATQKQLDTVMFSVSMVELHRRTLDVAVKNGGSILSKHKGFLGKVLVDLSGEDISKGWTQWYDLSDDGVSSQSLRRTDQSETLLNSIFTELYITQGQSEEVNTQHEVRQLETASKKETLHDTPIKCQDIFKASPDQQTPIRAVLTNGVAGVGKTFSVQKFTLDWAEGLGNQDVSLVIPLSFRELNLIKGEQYSLLRLLHVFHPTLQKVTAEQLAVCKVLLIFDGLDESRLSLDFRNNEVVSDVSQKSSVNVLLTNLIRGKLLPSALVWITSRPAAANQIPPECVDRVTEVRGFTDAQKEEYFRRRSSDEDLSSRIISHIKSSRSLHIMCLIPVFCWITAAVLDHMLTTDQRGELPQTLTDMYSHFLLVQTKRKKQKYEEGHETSPQQLTEADRELLLKLGRLAFEHLEKGHIMFYQKDLQRCGLGVTEALVHSGVCTEIFKRERVIFQKTVYCFVHLSIQEFLAAVYLFHCYTNRDTAVLKDFLKKDWPYKNSKIRDQEYPSLDVFLKGAMEKSLRSRNGHLDLFVRFLHGLSLESNQRLLGGLLGRTDNRPETIQRAISNLKEVRTTISPERSINIFHCLTEMKDLSVHQEITEFLKSGNRSRGTLCDPLLCSGLHAADVRGGSG
ncbi:hypothetical protein JOQ06_027978 [Pogonophryne albipinna]|uniref:NACHT domain-containing protein n=1 Tax=Pogonophryne albipinna TaxID=1090488 RepID=A0AAD6A8K0_9TELE|nr:hypothetical protein JOQ06_027978 [Pogonophryne albipinna]